MISDKTKLMAKKFQELHKKNEMFVLPNVWNAGSAKVFEKEGFSAVATTSAGVAYAMGYPDGEDIGLNDLVNIVKQITKRVDIPVSCDFERGYSDNIKEIKQNAIKLLEAGACGFNIEDGELDGKSITSLDIQIEKIKALVELKKELDVDFVINARTCIFWLNLGEDKINDAIKRCNAYLEAGADCAFIPGVMDRETVEKLVDNINGPVNIILNPKFNDLKELNNIGVRRLSIGSGAVRSTYGHIIDIAKDLKNNNVDTMLNCKFSYKDANEYFR